MYFQKLNFIDATYMTIITVSTVGYSMMGELDNHGKLFVIILIFLTLGSFLYALSVVTSFVVEGEIREVFNVYRVNREVAKMKDHIIICGLGRNGREAAKELREQDEDYVAIERNKDTINNFIQLHPEAIVLEGDAADEEVLQKANVKNAKGIITCLSDDADNVYVTLSARELNSSLKIVARASQEHAISKLHKAGANSVVVPNMIGGRKMANIITKPALVDFVDFVSGQGDSRYDLEEIDCNEFPSIAGKPLGELEIKSHSGAMVMGYKDVKGIFHLNPPIHKEFEKGEIIFILGSREELKKFREVFS